MFGMPVTSLTFLAIAALLLAPTFTHAQTRVIIKRAYQLEHSPRVLDLSRHYEALVGASVFYDKCSKDVDLADEQRTYLRNKFASVAKAYQQAFQDAYMDYVGSPPNQALVNDIAVSIKAQQQRTVNGMTQQIQKWSCRNARFTEIRTYVHKLHKADVAAPPPKTRIEPKVKF